MLKPITGFFDNIHLGFTPDDFMPRELESKEDTNYPTRLAYLHIYLDGKDVTKKLPSAFLCLLLEGLFKSLPILLSGGESEAGWYSDPWVFNLQGVPTHNRAIINLHVPGRWVAMEKVQVPLDKFGSEVIRLGKQWLKFLQKEYYDEVTNPVKGKLYRQLENYMIIAEKSLREQR